MAPPYAVGSGQLALAGRAELNDPEGEPRVDVDHPPVGVVVAAGDQLAARVGDLKAAKVLDLDGGAEPVAVSDSWSRSGALTAFTITVPEQNRSPSESSGQSGRWGGDSSYRC